MATNDDLRMSIVSTAKHLGINPLDLATVMSYETGGTFDPWQKGPTTKWGQHRGLIQWGEPQRQKYGVDQNTPVGDQVAAAGRYLQDAGVQPGMGRLDIYSAVNAGRVGRYNASDAAAGGAPGTVRDKVEQQMGGHEQKAASLLGGSFTPAAEQVASAAPRSSPAFGSMAGAGAADQPMAPIGNEPDPKSHIADLIAQLVQQQPEAPQPVQPVQFAPPSQNINLAQFLAALNGGGHPYA